jgi:hypothetical protein
MIFIFFSNDFISAKLTIERVLFSSSKLENNHQRHKKIKKLILFFDWNEEGLVLLFKRNVILCRNPKFNVAYASA